MRVEEKYTDVLQNIESMIIRTYRKHRDLSDYQVMNALEALIDAYTGEKIGRPPRNFRLSDVERLLMDDIRQICEWHLGRQEMQTDESSASLPAPEPITVDEIILCLKKILKSVTYWNKEAGRQGYLDFVAQYVF